MSRSAIQSKKGVTMGVFNWLTNRFTNHGKALAGYRRGMKKARNRDHVGAIGDYTTAINTPNITPDVKAMAQYNRALAHRAAKDVPKAVEDLNLILAMNEMLTNVKTMARQELVRIERRSTTSRA